MKKQYKKLILVSILVVLMLASTLPAMGAPDKVRVFVEFSPEAKGQVQQLLKNESAQFHYTFDELNSFVVTIPSHAIKGLERNPNVVEIEEDVPRYLVKSTAVQAAVETAALWEDAGTIEEGQVLPWGVQAVQAPQVWNSGTPSTGEGVKVCIVDTGYYADHEDFDNVLHAGTAQLDAPYTTDGYGHGTHVAGTIAAQDNELGVIGVSPGVSFYIIKYFGDDGAATLASDLIAAAYTCRDNGADIISMSLSGTRYSRREERAFDSVYASGLLSIGAASNDGAATYHYPASYDSVVSVAALDANELYADFSQYNDAVEIAAPGVGVLSTLPYIDITELNVNGTDYTAYHVEFSGDGPASGTLVDGGLCTSTGAWTGAVVLCERGDISFADKIINVENSGGVAAIIYNNVPDEELFATMGDFSSPIIGVGVTQEIGQYLLANIDTSLTASLNHINIAPASGYEAWNGTSMATPHISAVAALLWSYDPSLTNVEIRNAMNATAKDLGAAGRDVHYGYGLVQAYEALVYLGGGGTVNEAPVVSITSPTDGSAFDEGTAITFAATAIDAEDGNLAGSLTWTSSINGTIGSGTGFSVSDLSVGTHTITASVTDSGGKPGADAISVTVTSNTPNTAPVVTITTPATGTSVEDGTAITFAATASDTEDGNLSGELTWMSSLDGTIGSGTGFSVSNLSVGTHTITASVTDSGGLTDSDNITVTITESSGGGELVVTVNTNKTIYADRERVYITVTVTDGSAPVAGANVTTTITTYNGNTKIYIGVTGTDGTALFSAYKTFIRKDGAGLYTVDAVASLSGYTDGSDTATFTVQ
jgi:subtilisin family serine protease